MRRTGRPREKRSWNQAETNAQLDACIALAGSRTRAKVVRDWCLVQYCTCSDPFYSASINLAKYLLRETIEIDWKLKDAPWSLPWCPWNAPSGNLRFPHRVPFTKEKMPVPWNAPSWLRFSHFRVPFTKEKMPLVLFLFQTWSKQAHQFRKLLKFDSMWIFVLFSFSFRSVKDGISRRQVWHRGLQRATANLQ